MNRSAVITSLITLVLLLTSCQNKKHEYNERGLRKLTDQELIDKTEKRQIVNPKEYIVRDLDGNIIPSDSIDKLLPNKDLWLDQFVDNADQLVELVLRPITEEDRQLSKKLQSAYLIGPEVSERSIDCENLSTILKDIEKVDQGMRTGEIPYDADKDFENLEIVVNMIEKCGALDSGRTDSRQLGVVWLVLQHGTLRYMKKYLPALTRLAEKGELRKSSIALMTDRILMSEGKPQIYGSQIRTNQTTGEYEIYTLEDPETVDKRRATMGLGTLSEYVSRWNIRFDVVQRD